MSDTHTLKRLITLPFRGVPRRMAGGRGVATAHAVLLSALLLVLAAPALMAQPGTVLSHQKISDTAGGFPGTLDDFDRFGGSVALLGDLDGDGTQDIAVGASSDDDGGNDRGAVWVLFLNTDGTVKSHRKISDTEGGFTGTLDDFDRFGCSVAGVGDLDGDGIQDIAVGAAFDDDGGSGRGAVWVLFLNADGTVKSHQKISDTAGGFTGTLDDDDGFGLSVAALGDLDGDGIEDIAVGAVFDDDGGLDRGAVWVLFLNTDGTVSSHQKISDTEGGFTGTLDDEDLFGISVAGLGDLDGDGKRDIAVGAYLDDDGGSNRGAVWVLFLDGMVVPNESAPADTPGTHLLEAAYPNPFNPEATFRFAAYEQQRVRAVLVDVLGRVVATLFEGEVAAGQVQTVRIDGAGLPSGTYAVRLTGETFSDALTVTLLK
ncbi:MAG: FG-GAP repeat protein [Bacteroidetes bacterium]|nr:FG-GAP repeat protein [Bacteroidota bacterium]